MMKIESTWTFDCEPHHIWPHFFEATMDSSRPLLFRLGVPKPISCRVIEGAPAVGNTRQCLTDRGTIDQDIIEFIPGRRLCYRMKKSELWCDEWVEQLVDTFTLVPHDSERTLVRRETEFRARPPFPGLKALALWAALHQAHAYAASNWRRLSLEARRVEAARQEA